MLSAFVLESMVAISPSVTRCRCPALKGPHEIAQGKALGCATKCMMSPERAKSRSVLWAEVAGRDSSCAMPPFQGGNRVGIGFPGLRPGLSHSAPLGPAIACVPDLTPLREIGKDVVFAAGYPHSNETAALEIETPGGA